MLSSYPLWWFALPVLLLPIWWHRQKRQRLKAEPLATARFLPVAAPEQMRVWQWRDRVLLVVRCLLLVALIAWLAATIFPWRGDTVLLDAGADKSWAEREIAAAGFADARRVDLPPDGLQWLRQHERDWRQDARLLVVARADRIPMPARLPRFGHRVELRTMPAASAAASGGAAEPRAEPQRVGLSATPESADGWRALLAAFGRAGDGANRYLSTDTPDAGTKLLVWDKPGAAPPAGWRAADWWISTASATRAAFPELEQGTTLTINGIALKYADSARGRLWTSDAFPPRDADTARVLYEAWQALGAAPAPAYPTPSRVLAVARPSSAIDARPADWLGYLLLALFLLERIVAHARRN